ncbi:MAG: hypothetical protein JWO31_3349 [Phycisphaerales bacterium]|nr:hypothetical protein [Phycisphaerales bacterium]
MGEDATDLPATRAAERVEVRRAERDGPFRAAAPSFGTQGEPFADLSAPLGGVLGSGKRAFVRTFKWVGLLAVIVTAAAAAWAGGGGRTGRGALAAFLVLGPSVVIAVVLAGRLAAWALAAEARLQLGTAAPAGGDVAARAQVRSAVVGAVLAMLAYATLATWAVRAIWQ